MNDFWILLVQIFFSPSGRSGGVGWLWHDTFVDKERRAVLSSQATLALDGVMSLSGAVRPGVMMKHNEKENVFKMRCSQ
ncbi:hypothetical protein B0T14DRAFT_522013 [Immersiella caudata]|uniref:Secreted protein n=1 Tax=Immersiella caudata TaxID=314043 RepID=A0AA39WSE7_9PEZI|nr:hypothetical protein B0T14DRAFT_522013 [Immersiella caudata]